MRIPSFLPSPVPSLLWAINRLLAREPWAAQRLAAHAGKTFRLRAGDHLGLQATIDQGGSLLQADPAILPDVILSLPSGPADAWLSAWQRDGMAALAQRARVEGDAGLAQVLSDLAAQLRWDAEEDLAQLVGDWPALRLLWAGHRLRKGVRRTGRAAVGNLFEYMQHESGLTVDRAQWQAWRGGVVQLQGSLQALEARLAQLERNRP